MTDYREFNSSHRDPYAHSSTSSTSVGGILIALALIALIFLALSLLFTGTTSDRPIAPVIDETTSQPVAPVTPVPAE
jgi:hypothetical protein